MKQNKLRQKIKEVLQEAYIDPSGNLKDFSMGSNNPKADKVINQMKDLATNLGKNPSVAQKQGTTGYIPGKLVIGAFNEYISDLLDMMDDAGYHPSDYMPGGPDVDFSWENLIYNVTETFKEDDTANQLFTPEEVYSYVEFFVDTMDQANATLSPDAEGAESALGDPKIHIDTYFKDIMDKASQLRKMN